MNYWPITKLFLALENDKWVYYIGNHDLVADLVRESNVKISQQTFAKEGADEFHSCLHVDQPGNGSNR